MFVVADVSATGLSGSEFARRLLDDTGVAVMPGESFGRYGAGMIRISVTVADELIAEAAERIARFADGRALV